MSYKVDFDALDILCVNINTQISEWNENISSVSEKLNIILSENQMTGNGAENIKSYIQTVHVAIIQSLLQILQSHGQNCLMYKSDYQQNIDTSLHAVIQSEELFDIRKSLTSQRSETWLVDRNIRNALTSVSDLIYTNLKSSDEMDGMYGTINSALLNLESDISNLENHHLNNDFDDVQNMIEALKTFINDQLSKTKNYLVEYTPHQLANSEIYADLYNANETLVSSQSARTAELQLAYEHESHRAQLLEEEAAQKREEEGWWNALAAVGTIVIGTVAIVCTAGMATPVVVTAAVAGSCTIAYGTSNLVEAGQDIYYGAHGDATTVAFNPIRDTVFAGNQELYDIWGGISTTVAGFVVPVRQAYTTAKAADATTKVVVSTVGKAAVKEVAEDVFVSTVSLGTGNVVMNITGDANVSRLFSLGTGLFAGGKTNQALDSLDNVSSTVRRLDNLDDVTDVTKTLDDFTDSTKNIEEFIGGNKSFDDVVDDYAKIYADNINSNRVWSWDETILGGESLTKKQRSLIKQQAINNGLIPEITVTKVDGMRYGFADFESAGLVKETVFLPEDMWKMTDAEQFRWLDEQIGGAVDGYTWHHTEIPGKMELVPTGIHNITIHNGGRTAGMWADAKR